MTLTFNLQKGNESTLFEHVFCRPRGTVPVRVQVRIALLERRYVHIALSSSRSTDLSIRSILLFTKIRLFCMAITLNKLYGKTPYRANDKRAIRTCTRTGTVPLVCIILF